jgi:hypothetical protein
VHAPLQQGTLKPFSGELVQGAFLTWLGTAAPEVAAWLHEGQKRRLEAWLRQVGCSHVAMESTGVYNKHMILQDGDAF